MFEEDKGIFQKKILENWKNKETSLAQPTFWKEIILINIHSIHMGFCISHSKIFHILGILRETQILFVKQCCFNC